MSWLEEVGQSLRGRLSLSLVAGALAVMAVSFVALHMLIRDELYHHLDRDLAGRMTAVAMYAAAHPTRESVVEYMPQFRTRTHEDFFQIWDEAGRTLARSDSSAGRDLPRLEAVVGRTTYYDLTLPDGHVGRAVAEIIELPIGDVRGSLTVVTAEETESLNRLERRIHFMLFFVAATTTLALLAMAQVAVRRVIRRVDEFASALDRVDPVDPQARWDARSLPTELRPVAASFSELYERLLETLAREKRYARNIAHELRNPLAEMRLLTDVGAASQDAAACQAAIRDIGATAAEMEQIVDALMALTRCEAGLESPQPEPVDLVAELRRQARAKAPAADVRAIRVELDLPAELWVYTDSALVQRLVANLVDNAVSHSPGGATVSVTLGDSGEVTIANPAPHLVGRDVNLLGERFLRVESEGAGSHAGLGLPLAAAIAKVLGLTFGLAFRDDGHLVASIRGFRLLGTSAATFP